MTAHEETTWNGLLCSKDAPQASDIAGDLHQPFLYGEGHILCMILLSEDDLGSARQRELMPDETQSVRMCWAYEVKKNGLSNLGHLWSVSFGASLGESTRRTCIG